MGFNNIYYEFVSRRSITVGMYHVVVIQKPTNLKDKMFLWII